MMDEFIILGDSHTRSFAHISNIIPVFMGPGDQVNLSYPHVKLLKAKILDIISSLPKSTNYKFVTYLGEPNVRYSLKNDWTPNKNPHYIHTRPIAKEYLGKCIENYKQLIDDLGCISYILTPTTAFKACFESLEYFNRQLIEVFGDMVINIYEDTITSTGFKDEFKDPDFLRDPIHLNSKVSGVFTNKLLDLGIITKTQHTAFIQTKAQFNSKDLRDLFIQNKFGTYTIKK